MVEFWEVQGCYPTEVVLFFPVWEDDAGMSRCAVLSLSTEMVSVLLCLATLKNFSPGSSTSNRPSYGLLRGGQCLSYLIKTNLSVFSLGEMLGLGLPYLVVRMGPTEQLVPLFPSPQPCGLAHG